jgi:NAD(P)-dependent dehydrogenase (short-subunit alcohol dehydrogenase family)
MSDMQGDVVVITGAAAGVGRALALEAGRRGARVVVADIVDGSDTVAAIERAGGTAVAQTTDVSDFADVEALVRAAEASYGQVNVLVNNAALSKGAAPLDVADPAATRRLFDVGILGVFHGIRAFAASLRASAGAGRRAIIVNVGSEHSLGVPPHVQPISTYTVSKYATLGLTDTARRDLGPAGVQVSMLAPSWVRTEKVREIVRASPQAAAAIEPHAQDADVVATAAWDGVLAGHHIVVTNPTSRSFALQHARDVMAEVQRLPEAVDTDQPEREHGHDGTGDAQRCPMAHLFDPSTAITQER